MEGPFIYGKLVEGVHFTNREEEIEQLKNNLETGINSILISPRRWGKSSVVKKTCEILCSKNKKIKAAFIDLQSVRSEEEFYRDYSEVILRATASGFKEMVNNIREFLSYMIPKISISPDEAQEFSFSVELAEIKRKRNDIIDLPQKIAEAKKIRLVVCIDEFQNTSHFKDPLAFQKLLRSRWQHHTNVTYVLYGSKRHMMNDVFNNTDMPFYKFGEIIYLQKIAIEVWIKFLVKRFEESRKKISPENARLLATLAECHPFHVQQLAQAVWLRTKSVVKEPLLHESLDSIILQYSLQYQAIVDDMSDKQINYLRAIIEVGDKLTSAEILRQYRLGTSANVLKMRAKLIQKDIIDTTESHIEFVDPIFKMWLKQKYFVKKMM